MKKINNDVAKVTDTSKTQDSDAPNHREIGNDNK